ncbi:hypothetical protein DPMN_096256 [Dreissena polymorpha]|uniref:Uncharacterized protein n=1 Tax=Dreissena polymorpha TaxID=45954 RepID=A0A9D4R3M2_DREPO|nr:hypothetical protein DPMN_096256 [Dreissena polymorpha]
MTPKDKIQEAVRPSTIVSTRTAWSTGSSSDVVQRRHRERSSVGRPADQHIITASFHTNKINVDITQWCSPTNDGEEGEEVNFSNRPSTEIQDRPKKNIILLTGDFNAKIGSVNRGYRKYLIGSSVSDQFSKAIQDRRKKLIPYLVQARQQGKDASLSYDVLYIDMVRYTHDRPLRVQYRNCRNTTTGTDLTHILQPEGEAVHRNATRSSSVIHPANLGVTYLPTENQTTHCSTSQGNATVFGEENMATSGESLKIYYDCKAQMVL